MNIEIIIKTEKDGKVTLSCPHFPSCVAEGTSADEAAEKLTDLLAEVISKDLKTNLKPILLEAVKNMPKNMNEQFQSVLTNFPVSLN